MDGSECFGQESKNAIIAWHFLIWYTFECCSEWINEYFNLKSFLTSFSMFIHSGFSVSFILFQYFAPELFYFLCNAVVGMSSCITSPLPVGKIFFHNFRMSCLSIVRRCLGIFLAFLLLPNLSLRVVMFVSLSVSMFSFHPNIFLRLFSFRALLLVIVDFLFVFTV